MRPETNLVFVQGSLANRFFSGEIIGKYMTQINQDILQLEDNFLNNLEITKDYEKRKMNWFVIKKEMEKFGINID